MKIDNDLRLTINAAARNSNRTVSWNEQHEQDQEAIAAFERGKGKKILAKARTLHAKVLELESEATKLRNNLRHLLHPVGLNATERGDKTEFDFQGGICSEEGREKFVAAGGVLPEAKRRKWTADEVMTKLAAADPKHLDKILAEYGINWK